MTQRFVVIGRATQQGKILPPLELYKLRRPQAEAPSRPQPAQGGRPGEVSEYYVVDGHHRVAIGRRLGQDFFDAHVIEHTVGESAGPSGRGPEATGAEPGQP
jgi:hypothetical protein